MNDEKDSAREPFLETQEEYQDFKTPRTSSQKFPILKHLAICVTYLITFGCSVFIWRILQPPAPGADLLYLPASEAIQYEVKLASTHFPNNPFMGDPSPEHDQAWRELMNNTNIKISGEDLRRMNRTSLALKDGSGYLAQLGAYHELHCIVFVRKWINKEHYWPMLEGAQLQERKAHIDHCLESMRLGAMCRGDRTVETFEWFGSQARPQRYRAQTCINWDMFEKWNADRRVDLYDLDQFVGRPEPQPWEYLDHDVRLGILKGAPEMNGGFAGTG